MEELLMLHASLHSFQLVPIVWIAVRQVLDDFVLLAASEVSSTYMSSPVHSVYC